MSTGDGAPYLEVTPSPEPITQARTHQQLKRLHPTGLTIECLLVSTGPGTVEYYLGADEHHDRLANAVRSMTPTGYDLVPADDPCPPVDGANVTATRLVGRGPRRQDWQLPLAWVPAEGDWTTQPLGDVVQTMAATEATVVYQAVLSPKPDWSHAAEDRTVDLMINSDTLRGFLVSSSDDGAIPRNQARIDAIETVDHRRCYTVNARAVAWGPGSEPTLAELGEAFTPIEGEYYAVRPTQVADEDADAVVDRLETATVRDGPRLHRRLAHRLPLVAETRPDVVADYRAAPQFFLFDDRGLTAEARRALEATPGEQTGLTLPASSTLETFGDAGLTLGTPLTNDRAPAGDTIALPPSLQPLHTAWFGTSGSGKTVAAVRALVDNHAATDGATVLIDQKGDQSTCREYLRAHETRFGDCEDVLYFDCARTVPAISFFDVTDRGDVPRQSAVQDVVEHYLEILAGFMGRERFEQAVRAPDVIRYLVRALFDPVYGSDRFAHRDLLAAVDDLATSHEPPPVSDQTLHANLEGVTTLPDRTLGNLVGGVRTRVEKVTTDDRVAAMFDHVHEPDDEQAPDFAFGNHLDSDRVVLFDLGGLRAESRAAVTLTLLSQLWTAFRTGARRDADGDRLVNLHVEEAGTVAATDLMGDLLRESRSYGLAVSLSMQFPEQLEAADPDAYQELLHEVSTVVAGPGASDRALVERLATDETRTQQMRNKLDALGRGQWLVDLPEAFGEAPPRPFLVESAPPAPGTRAAGESTPDTSPRQRVSDRTRDRYGISVSDGRSETSETPASATPGRGSRRVTTTLPFTSRMPDCVTYDQTRDAIECDGDSCEKRFPVTDAGMKRAIACCHDVASLDRDDVPICRTPLPLSPGELARSAYSDRQLCFLRAVHDATNRRHDPELAYDITRDSMLRLREYVGLADEGVEELLADGLLRHDHDMPHRLFTVTPEGRSEISAAHRDGVTFGDGEGDLNESSLHVVMVEAGYELVETRYAADPASPVEEVARYHDVGDHRLDVAGLDADGGVVVALEAERDNNDYKRSIPADFDAMASHDPSEALWVVENVDGAHALLAALTEPADGEPRLSTSYSRTTRPQQWQLDAPGCTEVVPLQYVRTELLDYPS